MPSWPLDLPLLQLTPSDRWTLERAVSGVIILGATRSDERAGARTASRVPGPRKPLRVGKALSAEGDRERRGAGGGVKAQPNPSSDSPRNQRREETGRPRRMVSRATQRGGPCADREVGAAHGREGGAVLRAKNEDQMG